MKLGGFNIPDPPTQDQVASWMKYELARRAVAKQFSADVELRAWEIARKDAGLEEGDVLLMVVHEDD